MTHLRDTDHPYYCSEGHYNSSHSTWADFLAEWGNADPDMNLLFRWDWKKADPDAEDDKDKIVFFFLHQRKWNWSSATVEVSPEDEAKVIEFLLPKWEYMKTLWSGISNHTEQYVQSIP